MIVLLPDGTEQTFTVIPRFAPSTSVDVTLRSETQNKETHSFSYAATYENGYLSITNTFDPVLVKNNFYELTVKESSELLFRGRIFVTDQTDLPKFTVNDDKFTVYEDNNNEFIVL